MQSREAPAPWKAGSALDHCVQHRYATARTKGMAMKKANTGMNGFQAILELRKAELVQVLRRPDGIAIEKSADQMDEIQYASERDLAILNVDRESTTLRDVKAALRRMHDGGFGTCVDCERPIGAKRLEAVPWASRCVQCQDAAERNGHERSDLVSETVVNAM